MLCKYPVQQLKILRRHPSGAPINLLAVPQRQLGQSLAKHVPTDGEIIARVAIALTPQRIVVDHPADAQPTQAEGLREVADRRRIGKPRGGSHLSAVIDRMIYLVGNEQNAALRAEIVQALD